MSQRQSTTLDDKPFPLKRYYILYAGIGGIIFYAMLFSFFIHAERQALYNQYIENLLEKAGAFYRDVNKGVFQTYHASMEDETLKQAFRIRIEALVKTDFSFAKVKLFDRNGVVLYSHADKASEGEIYDSVQGQGFQTALANKTFSKLEEDVNGKRFMEVYLPTYGPDGVTVAGVLEVYEDVTRFEATVFKALKEAFVVPTLIFMVFNIMLLVLVLKADGVITANTQLLNNVRKQMEKYISRSAMEAIYSAVTEEKELFKGEVKEVVIFFSDIRGFTAYSEHEKPEIVVENINRLFELQADIIHKHHGIIDKFVGDEIMALFPTDKAQNAVQAALEIQAAIEKSALVNFELGIGLHYGEALLGSIGTHERRDYTVIGNIVNTGARFCGAAKGGQVIISDVLCQKLDEVTKQRFSLNEPLQLKGKQETIVTYVG